MSHLASLTGTCPVCNGAKEVANPHRPGVTPCQNCGGQTMFGKPSGVVPLRPDGNPCKHSFCSTGGSRNYTKYACPHCGSSYSIDSGD